MFKLNKVRISIITAILGLTSVTGLQASAYSSSQNSEMSDQQLDQEIRDKIGHGWFDKGYDQITVEVNNGVVTLDGVVRTQSDKDKIDKNVRNMDGVKGLNSKITLVEAKNPNKQFPQDTFASEMDNQLNQKIRDSVSIGWFDVDYKSVSLNTANGFVTVKGTVDSVKTEKHLLNEIQEVDGVTAVKSELLIQDY